MNPLHYPEFTQSSLDEIALTAMGEELDDQVLMPEVSIKSAKAAVGALASQARIVTASAALDLLRHGEAMAAQISYVLADVRCIDTFLRDSAGHFRLVRMRLA